MKDEKKVCKTCGRIITNPNNKTGLCPKCQKAGNNILGAFGAVGLAAAIKKFGPKAVKGLIGIVKR